MSKIKNHLPSSRAKLSLHIFIFVSLTSLFYFKKLFTVFAKLCLLFGATQVYKAFTHETKPEPHNITITRYTFVMNSDSHSNTSFKPGIDNISTGKSASFLEKSSNCSFQTVHPHCVYITSLMKCRRQSHTQQTSLLN